MGRHLFLGEASGQKGGSLAPALEKAGFRVTRARDSLEFMQLCRREPADALVLDTALPWHSPAVVCRLLRTQPQTAGVPLLVIHPPEDRAAGDQCLEAGADRLLERPVDGAELAALLRSALGLRPGRPGAAPAEG